MEKRRKVFACSMGDLFHEDVPFDEIDHVIAVIRKANKHTFMVLTKRPGRMAEYFERLSGENIHIYLEAAERNLEIATPSASCTPLHNLWLGVTAENQAAAEERIPILLRTPAAKRFVSVEPMLGPVDLRLLRSGPCNHNGCLQHISHPCEGCGYQGGKLPIDWVICGGETGPGARPMQPEWARSLRHQCRRAGVSFFMKKMSGGAPPPADLMVREYPEADNGNDS